MLKWIVAFLVVVGLIATAVFSSRWSTKTTYVNGLAEFNQLPGKEFIFERDCYIFKFKKASSTYPFVGANSPGLSASVGELPEKVDASMIGKDLPEVRLLDVVKAGSRFRIVSVRKDENSKGAKLTLEILFTNEDEWKYPRLDAYYILDHSVSSLSHAPEIVQEFAVPRIKK